MARPGSPPCPCRDRTVSKATLPGRACTDKVDRRTRVFRARENTMVFLGIDVSKGRLDCAVLAAEGGRPPGRRSFRNEAEGGLSGISCVGGHDRSEGAPTCRDAKSR